MKLFKKLTSLILCLSLVVSILAIPTSAEGFSYEFERNSQSIYMFSLDNNECVYSYDADTQRPIASLTKIMTFIVVSECIPDLENTIVTVDQVVADELEGTGSSLAGINVGEELSFLQLLNLMMVPSGNDAALAMAVYITQHEDEISEYLASKSSETSSDDSTESTDEESSEYAEGDAKDVPDPVAVNDGESTDTTSEESTESSSESSTTTTTTSDSSSSGVSESSQYFVSLMNEKARELGCMDTHFVNPHGLNDSNHYSTARDLAKIVSYATTLPYFSQIVSQTSYTLPATNIVSEERTVTSTNKMLSSAEEYYYMYANGIKTGSHDQAGYCIAASATYEGYTYVCICLGSPMVDSNGETINYHGEMVDAATLFRWAFLNLSMKNVAEAGDLLAEVNLEYAWNQDKLQLVAAENVSAILPSDVSTSSILCDVDIPETVQAPVKKGDVIGTATFTYAGEKIATVNLVASESVERSQLIQTIQTTAGAFASPLVLAVIALVLVAIFIYIVVRLMYNKRKKKMRKIKRYRNL